MSGERSVLIVAQRPSDYVEMRRCAVALHERGWRVVMAYHCIYMDRANEQGILDDIDQLTADGVFGGSRVFAVIQRKAAPSTAPAAPQRVSWTTPLWLAIHRAISWLTRRPRAMIRDVAIFLYNVRTYLKRLPEYDALMQQWRPDAMILPEDVVGLVTPLIIRAGQRNGVPSLILPYTIANQQEAFQSLKSNPSYQLSHLANWLCGLIWPRWVMRQDGHALIRLPAPHVVAHALTRVAPPDPWMMNSGYANAIAVENDAMLDYYRQAGIPAGKMHVVGAVYDDYLAKFLLEKPAALACLRAELGIANAKPLLVVGGCPDQTGNCPPGFEFADMADFGAQLAAALRPLAGGYEIIVRPHPNYAEFATIMAEAGIRTTQVDTARLVALADLYVAFGSATIRWAISCAVPTVNYDVFHYAYDDFTAVAGVVNVDSYGDFAGWMARLAPCTPDHAALAAAIRGSAPRWGRLDGRSVDRIIGLLDQLCAEKPVPRTSA